MSPPTPEDEVPVESPTQTPTPVPTPSSTTALGRSETTPPRAVVHAPSPSDEATRAAYIAAADFDDDVPLPGETLTSEELEFYSDVREEQDAPGEDPFVEVGNDIKVGQTICILEAMKLMNEIESEFNAEIVEILVENGTPVEFGQVLMRVKQA